MLVPHTGRNKFMTVISQIAQVPPSHLLLLLELINAKATFKLLPCQWFYYDSIQLLRIQWSSFFYPVCNWQFCAQRNICGFTSYWFLFVFASIAYMVNCRGSLLGIDVWACQLKYKLKFNLRFKNWLLQINFLADWVMFKLIFGAFRLAHFKLDEGLKLCVGVYAGLASLLVIG